MSVEQWRVFPTDLYDRQFEFYEKKRADQLKAVLRNLARYMEMLKAQSNPRMISANFIHNERQGLLALTQQGYKPKQPKTRLYIYPEVNSKRLYLITIGDASNQDGDVKDAHRFIEKL